MHYSGAHSWQSCLSLNSKMFGTLLAFNVIIHLKCSSEGCHLFPTTKPHFACISRSFTYVFLYFRISMEIIHDLFVIKIRWIYNMVPNCINYYSKLIEALNLIVKLRLKSIFFPSINRTNNHESIFRFKMFPVVIVCTLRIFWILWISYSIL